MKTFLKSSSICWLPRTAQTAWEKNARGWRVEAIGSHGALIKEIEIKESAGLKRIASTVADEITKGS